MNIYFVVRTNYSEEIYNSWYKALEAQGRYWSKGVKAEIVTRYEARKRG